MAQASSSRHAKAEHANEAAEFLFVFQPHHELPIAGAQAQSGCFPVRGDRGGGFGVVAFDQHGGARNTPAGVECSAFKPAALRASLLPWRCNSPADCSNRGHANALIGPIS